jgi:hypothetical protein
MMKTSMSCFHTPEIVVAGTIADILYAGIITQKVIGAIGKPVPNAERTLTPRIMWIPALMNIILRNLRIRQSMSQPDARSVIQLSYGAKVVSHQKVMTTFV